MKIGILGLPQAGKTTLFQALTRGQAQSTSSRGEKVHLGSVQVPDKRLDRLGQMYTPKKFTPAKVDYVDAPALETTGRERGALAHAACLLEGARSRRAASQHLHQARPGERPRVSGSAKLRAHDEQWVRSDARCLRFARWRR